MFDNDNINCFVPRSKETLILFTKKVVVFSIIGNAVNSAHILHEILMFPSKSKYFTK